MDVDLKKLERQGEKYLALHSHPGTNLHINLRPNGVARFTWDGSDDCYACFSHRLETHPNDVWQAIKTVMDDEVASFDDDEDASISGEHPSERPSWEGGDDE